ncbi:MAG: radical SAM protein [Desulfobacterales bacterium]|nr:radical SAM protein [Desulfobacterales bacterium]
MKHPRKRSDNAQQIITAVVASAEGEIFELEGYGAVSMAGPALTPLTEDGTIKLPHGSELMLLPDRSPVLWNIAAERYEIIAENPYAPGEALFPVAAFNSPGYVITGVSAYEENPGAGYLPLFSYGAAGWHNNGFRAAALQVDRERRQDLRLMKPADVTRGVRKKQKSLPGNRLRAHLEKCALTYGCPAGKNFFLGRYEAPLPTSQSCNARCLGCISLQKNDLITASQNRIAFTPSPAEIAQVALAHIRDVKQSVVSFGQGCEGDPLMAAETIEPAIREIRAATDLGTINMNTNGSRPAALEKLFAAGLDSIRISLNSVRQACYDAYFRPAGYRFADVLTSIALALERNIFVSINYLNCPGFTDAPAEHEALMTFLADYKINMIQWRNLNYDPLRYWQAMGVQPESPPLGMRSCLARVKGAFPQLMHGYFNPPREKWGRLGDNP